MSYPRRGALLLLAFVGFVGFVGPGCRGSAHIDVPRIGTRGAKTGALEPTDVAARAKFLGCDLHFARLAEGTQVTVEWRYYARTSDLATEHWSRSSERVEQELAGSGTVAAYLAPSPGSELPKGTYECRFRARGESLPELGALIARIRLGEE